MGRSQRKRDRKTAAANAQSEANAKAALAAEERRKNVDELSGVFTDFIIGNGYWLSDKIDELGNALDNPNAFQAVA